MLPLLKSAATPQGEPRTQFVASTQVATCGEEEGEELETRWTWFPPPPPPPPVPSPPGCETKIVSCRLLLDDLLLIFLPPDPPLLLRGGGRAAEADDQILFREKKKRDRKEERVRRQVEVWAKESPVSAFAALSLNSTS